MFTYKLRQADGTSADPPAIMLAVPNMRVGDTIPVRRGETFRVVGVVAGEDPTLIVEPVGSESDAA
jgi:hypothetical protein